MKPFTVYGIYEDTAQRWAQTFDARDPGHAQLLALEEGDDGLMIAAVVEGAHDPVDKEPYYHNDPIAADYTNWKDGVNQSN